MTKCILLLACHVTLVLSCLGGALDAVPDDATREALEELPHIGSGAEVSKTDKGLRAVAVGFGVCTKDGDNERLPLSARKAKAVRAAVVSAKAALGEKMSGQMSSVVKAVISDAGASLQSESVLSFARTVLTNCSLWKSETKVEEGDEKCVARAWIFFPSMEILDQVSVGLPRFADRRAASEFLVQAASKGLCDVGVMRLLVGEKGEEKLVRFVVATSSAQAPPAVAASRARAELLRQSARGKETIEGVRTLSRESRVLDSLSAEGNEEATKEVLSKTRVNEVSGVVRISADHFERTVGDIRFYVVSESSE